MRHHEDDDYDERMEAEAHRRSRRAHGCRCGSDMPGRCPGPDNCPLCEEPGDEEADEQ